MKFLPTTVFSALKSLLAAALFASELYAQNRATSPSASESSIFGSYGLYLGVLAIGIFAAVVIKLLRKKAPTDNPSEAVPEDSGGLMFKGMDQANTDERVYAGKDRESSMQSFSPSHKKTGFAALPVSTFVRLPRTSPYLQLSGSSEPELLDAIEKTNEDSDCDVVERSKALRVLTTYRTPNSIAAIAQIALYDLSSKLRVEAVSALAELDHESVFETIVTACADPSHGVRAAAARAFVKIGFDRGESWARIIESRDVGRMRHSARSAIEGDLVTRSFDRLVHRDRNIAYEAYALTALLVRSGETEPIYKALVSHRDENVKLALLHVLQTIKEDSTSDQLADLMTRVKFAPDVAAKANEVRACLQLSTA